MSAILTMLASVGLGFIAQMILKTGVGRIGGVNFTGKSAGRDFKRMLLNPFLLGALFLYFFSFLLYLKAISGPGALPLSVAYPMASLNLVLITIAARLFFDEQVSALRWSGVMLVLVGVVCIGLSAPRKAPAPHKATAVGMRLAHTPAGAKEKIPTILQP